MRKEKARRNRKVVAKPPDGWHRSDLNPAGRSGVLPEHINDRDAPVQYAINGSRSDGTITEIQADGRWRLETRNAQGVVIETSRHWDPLEAAYYFAGRLSRDTLPAAYVPTARPKSGQSRVTDGSRARVRHG